jgi:hypothetical protein
MYLITRHPCCGTHVGKLVESNDVPLVPRVDLIKCSDCSRLFVVEQLGVIVEVVHPLIGKWPRAWMRKLPPLTRDEELDIAIFETIHQPKETTS